MKTQMTTQKQEKIVAGGKTKLRARKAFNKHIARGHGEQLDKEGTWDEWFRGLGPWYYD